MLIYYVIVLILCYHIIILILCYHASLCYCADYGRPFRSKHTKMSHPNVLIEPSCSSYVIQTITV